MIAFTLPGVTFERQGIIRRPEDATANLDDLVDAVMTGPTQDA